MVRAFVGVLVCARFVFCLFLCFAFSGPPQFFTMSTGYYQIRVEAANHDPFVEIFEVFKTN